MNLYLADQKNVCKNQHTTIVYPFEVYTEHSTKVNDVKCK